MSECGNALSGFLTFRLLNTMKICHLTSAHPRNDVRIFEKECVSLATRSDLEVCLLVADGKGFQKTNGVTIHDIGHRKGRFNRFFVRPFKMMKKAFSIHADLIHFHDPELIFVGLVLKLMGKKVVYDVHEDVPKSLQGREWLPKWMLKIIAFKFKLVEDLLSRAFDGIITATPAISERFSKINSNTATIQNFPKIVVTEQEVIDFSKRNGICYIGAISRIRGIIPLMDSLSYCHKEIQLHIAGSFINSSIESEVRSHPNFAKVKFYGQLKREELQAVYDQSFAGIIPFLPLPNHTESQPNKFFEYMEASLAVVASDFPLWKDLIERNGIGYCVNPEDSKAIAGAINTLFNEKTIAKEMGEKGRKLVHEKYNWETEKQKLFGFYGEFTQISEKSSRR